MNHSESLRLSEVIRLIYMELLLLGQVGGRVPVLDTLVELVTRGRSIPVHLEYLPRLENLVAEVQAWKECAANTFLGENSPYSLLEVRDLSPV